MRRVLADTHAILWALEDNAALSALARDTLADPDVDLVVSAVTPFEVAVNKAVDKLDPTEAFLDEVEALEVTWLPVTAAHGWAVRDLPLHHRDPFDRLLVAQARIEGVPILTADRAFAAYDVQTVW